MQSVDFTTLAASCWELRQQWLPARLEQVYQRDRNEIAVALRTLEGRGWLTISWHPQAARICLGDAPPRQPDTFTFSQQLRHQLGGLALVAMDAIAPWERVLDLQFARRPGDPPDWHLYVEIMGKYSNVILTDAKQTIVTAAHQVSAQQSSVRPIQTGQPYELPPSLTETVPSLDEPRSRWQERLSLVPEPLERCLVKSYRGIGLTLARSMARAANLDPAQSSHSLTDADWQHLFQHWQTWLQAISLFVGNRRGGQGTDDEGYGDGGDGGHEDGEDDEGIKEKGRRSAAISPSVPHSNLKPQTSHSPTQPAIRGFRASTHATPQNSKLKTQNSKLTKPGWTETGYTVLGWELTEPAPSVQTLLNQYYTSQLNQQQFRQLRHQLQQRLQHLLGKLHSKQRDFQKRLQQSDKADDYRQQGNLLMAHLHLWQPGMEYLEVEAFETGDMVKLSLDPEKNAVQNAQARYKRHQKLKRSRNAIAPLLAEVNAEIAYLEQVQLALVQLDIYQAPEDLQALEEIREELCQQSYLANNPSRDRSQGGRDRNPPESHPHRFATPSGFELWVGRNNRQNDRLTFRTANDYDLWFHTQEIPSSHGLLRLEPGAVPDEADLQFAADLIAYYSQARQGDQVPVVYTHPRHVRKPKGAKPGMALYEQETILWGQPQRGQKYLAKTALSAKN